MQPVDLAPGMPSPAFLALAAPIAVNGSVTHDGEPVDAVRITATPTGLLSGSTSAAATTAAAADGSFTLALAPGAEYQLALTSRDRRYAYTAEPIVVAAAGKSMTLDPIAMVDAVLVTGSVTLSNPPIPAAFAHVMLFCQSCIGPAASRPVAEAVVDSGGAFTMVVPDAGTSLSSGVLAPGGKATGAAAGVAPEDRNGR